MKKLYRRAGAVHPSPPLVSDHLAFLPAAILTLAAALSPEDREILAYLLSCSTGSSSGRRKAAHRAGDPPLFDCSCFGCYTSYWARWDSSPSRQLIHEILDSFEDSLARGKNPKGGRKERRKRGFATGSESDGANRTDLPLSRTGEPGSAAVEATAGGGEGEEEKGSVRKLVTLIGERIWNVWGQ